MFEIFFICSEIDKTDNIIQPKQRWENTENNSPNIKHFRPNSHKHRYFKIYHGLLYENITTFQRCLLKSL